MSESDKKFYKRQEIHEKRKRDTLESAKARAERSVEWHKLNGAITKNNLQDFKKYVKGVKIG